jgi:class 3 adenylate cyclase
MAATDIDEVDRGEEAPVGARQGPGCTVVTGAVAAGPVVTGPAARGPVIAGAVASVAVDTGRVGAVLFADLTGFRALTDSRGDEGAAEAASRFVALVRRSLAPGAHVVKTLGDGVLIVASNLTAARATASTLRSAVAVDETLPPVHAGICAGSVVWRDGDVFGAAVNEAARLADAAGPSEIVEGRTAPLPPTCACDPVGAPSAAGGVRR